MPDINQVMAERGGPYWRSTNLLNLTRANDNISTNATEIPIIAGTRMVRLSCEGTVDWVYWITEAGITPDPPKATPIDGGQQMNGTAEETVDIWVDPDDLPEIWVAETGGGDITMHATFYS